MTVNDAIVFVDRPAGRVYYLAFDGILAAAPTTRGAFTLLEGTAVESPETARHAEIRGVLEHATFGGARDTSVHEIRVRRDGLPQPLPEENR
jgi:hypothetical protein